MDGKKEVNRREMWVNGALTFRNTINLSYQFLVIVWYHSCPAGPFSQNFIDYNNNEQDLQSGLLILNIKTNDFLKF